MTIRIWTILVSHKVGFAHSVRQFGTISERILLYQMLTTSFPEREFRFSVSHWTHEFSVWACLQEHLKQKHALTQ